MPACEEPPKSRGGWGSSGVWTATFTVGPAAPSTAASKPMSGVRASGSASATKPVGPTVVQAKPGATTTLMTTSAEPPAHHRPGQPKIAALPGQVDPSTLLPQSGPQAAASSPNTP